MQSACHLPAQHCCNQLNRASVEGFCFFLAAKRREERLVWKEYIKVLLEQWQ
jgi:hypothetical protein